MAVFKVEKEGENLVMVQCSQSSVIIRKKPSWREKGEQRLELSWAEWSELVPLITRHRGEAEEGR